MQQKLKIVAGAGIGLVVTAGAALAATPPDAASGLGRASEVTGTELPASHDSHPTADAHPSGAPGAETVEVEAPVAAEVEVPEVEVPEVEVPEEGAPEDGGPPADTHGADVSAVARDHSTTGAEHGAAVSAVARENGAEHRATPGADHDQAGDRGNEGAGDTGGHGRP